MFLTETNGKKEICFCNNLLSTILENILFNINVNYDSIIFFFLIVSTTTFSQTKKELNHSIQSLKLDSISAHLLISEKNNTINKKDLEIQKLKNESDQKSKKISELNKSYTSQGIELERVKKKLNEQLIFNQKHKDSISVLINKLDNNKSNLNYEILKYISDSIISSSFFGGEQYDFAGDEYELNEDENINLWSYPMSQSYNSQYDADDEYLEDENYWCNPEPYFIGYSSKGKLLVFKRFELFDCIEAGGGNHYELESQDLSTNLTEILISITEDNYVSQVSIYADLFDSSYDIDLRVNSWSVALRNIIINQIINHEIFNFDLEDFHKLNYFSSELSTVEFNVDRNNGIFCLNASNSTLNKVIYKVDKSWENAQYLGYYKLNNSDFLCLVLILSKKELDENQNLIQIKEDFKFIGYKYK